MKHVCVAARIGDGEALDAANIENIGSVEQRCQRRFWLQPRFYIRLKSLGLLLGLARVLAQAIVESP